MAKRKRKTSRKPKAAPRQEYRLGAAGAIAVWAGVAAYLL